MSDEDVRHVGCSSFSPAYCCGSCHEDDAEGDYPLETWGFGELVTIPRGVVAHLCCAMYVAISNGESVYSGRNVQQ